MILAEKITMLRKQNGWSQEELAMKLDISRQSVSKWESTASVPDLDKIIKLSQIFGVSTDYLLKDELEETIIPVGADGEDEPRLRRVSLDEANEFMSLTEKVAKWIAAGVSICILSPIMLIVLTGLAGLEVLPIREDVASGIGLIVLFLMVGSAVGIFILKGMRLSPYEYMEKEMFSLEYGVFGIVEKKESEFEGVFRICITIGVMLCIFGVIPLFLAQLFEQKAMLEICGVGGLLFMVACGVYLFVWSGMIKGSYQKLLHEGEYCEGRIRAKEKVEKTASIYWCSMTAIYLAASFLTMRWDRTWIIWPVAGVIWAVVVNVINASAKEN